MKQIKNFIKNTYKFHNQKFFESKNVVWKWDKKLLVILVIFTFYLKTKKLKMRKSVFSNSIFQAYYIKIKKQYYCS